MSTASRFERCKGVAAADVAYKWGADLLEGWSRGAEMLLVDNLWTSGANELPVCSNCDLQLRKGDFVRPVSSAENLGQTSSYNLPLNAWLF